MYRNEIGAPGLIISILLSAAMIAAAFMYAPPFANSVETGTCLPAANQWPIVPIASWALNLALLASVPVALYFLNKHYNFIKSNDVILPAASLFMLSSLPMLTTGLNSGIIICAVNMILLPIMFNVYKHDNATQAMFLVATFLSLGSMIDYAFVVYAVLYIIIAALMKILRLKEIIAYIFGLVAVYWIGIGFGLIHLDWFQGPELQNFIMDFEPSLTMIFVLSAIGLTLLWSVVMTLRITVKLYAGNARILCFTSSFTFLAIMSLLGMLIDYGNITAYIPSFYISSAVFISSQMALWPPKRPSMLPGFLAVIYVGLFTAMIYFR